MTVLYENTTVLNYEWLVLLNKISSNLWTTVIYTNMDIITIKTFNFRYIKNLPTYFKLKFKFFLIIMLLSFYLIDFFDLIKSFKVKKVLIKYFC